MSIMPPSPFISSATAETLPSEFSGKSHCSDGSFSIDEDSFFYAIDPPPLLFEQDNLEENEIEQILRALFQQTA
jgi:hypothetical protein